MNWQLLYTKQAQKDAKKLASSGLKPKAETLLTGIPRLARGHRRQRVEQKSSDLVDEKMRPAEFFGLKVLESNPFQNPPPFEKLVGDLAGAYSRRINIQHRLVYQVLPHIRTVKVIRLWSHYE